MRNQSKLVGWPQFVVCLQNTGSFATLYQECCSATFVRRHSTPVGYEFLTALLHVYRFEVLAWI
jgi:hypothetical protein